MVTLSLRTVIDAPIKRCFDLSRSIDVHLLSAASHDEQAVGGVCSGLIGMGQYVRWRARHFGVTQHLASRITAYDSPAYFQDTMIEGPFRLMKHDHFFRAINVERTEMLDRFQFAAPIPVLGLLAEWLFLRRHMYRFLQDRNQVLKRTAESEDWRQFLPPADS